MGCTGPPGELQARLIRQGLTLSAWRVLSLLHDSDKGSNCCFMLQNSLLSACVHMFQTEGQANLAKILSEPAIIILNSLL